MEELPFTRCCPHYIRKKRWNWIKIKDRVCWIQSPMQPGTNCCRRKANSLCRPNIIKPANVNFNPAEDELIISLYSVCTKWSEIAEYLPGRTENDIERHWNSQSMKMKVLSKVIAHAAAAPRRSTTYDAQFGCVHETKDLLSRFQENPEQADGESLNCNNHNNNNPDREINLELKIGPPSEIVIID